jgi:hypothetical protein
VESKFEEGRYALYVVDNYPYEQRDITDEEFAELLRAKSV